MASTTTPRLSILLFPSLTRTLTLPKRASLSIQSPLSLGFRTATSPPRSSSRLSVNASAQSNVFKVLRTAWRVANDGIAAGASLIPVSVPRPLAKIGVTGVAAIVALFLLKSFLSTLFFVLTMMGVIYVAYIALNTDEGTRVEKTSSSSEEETLEEARRIMEKYK